MKKSVRMPRTGVGTIVSINNDWDALLKEEFGKPYYRSLREFLKKEYGEHIVYPAMGDIFNALKYTPYSEVKAVILGQDPYHQPGQAHGLCFSVKRGTMPPPSLVNIFKELHDDCGIDPPDHGELTDWARRGVLLLNSSLTVRRGEPNSHSEAGWGILTDKIIGLLDNKETPVVFILWGAFARRKAALLHNRRHLILTASHPSPLSANKGGFFGCCHFSKANAFLRDNGVGEIDWTVDS